MSVNCRLQFYIILSVRLYTLKPKQITSMNDTRIPIRLDATQNDIGIPVNLKH